MMVVDAAGKQINFDYFLLFDNIDITTDPPKQFHVLLNSLFKVLLNCPSQYLSAIGLVSVFVLIWSLPTT